MAKLSLCMIAKNEEKWIDSCLESVKGLVDEIILVDTGSTDNTVEIAKKHGARVFRFKWSDDFSAARNESLKYATGDWVLVIDADEVISREDFPRIRNLISIEGFDGYFMVQRNYTEDRSVFGWMPSNDNYRESKKAPGYFVSHIVRLFKTSKEIFFENKVHEAVDDSIIKKKGRIAKAAIPIHHYGYLKGKEVIDAKREKYLKIGEEIIKKDPKNPKPYYDNAKIFKNTGNYEKAIDYLKKVIELDENYEIPYTNLGEIYSRQGKIGKAIEAYKKSIELKPKDENAYINLAIIYFDKGLLKESVHLLEKVTIMNPKNVAAYHNLSVALIKSKQYFKALSSLERAYRLTKLDRFKKAIESIEERLSKTSKTGKAVVFARRGKFEDAKKLFNEVIKEDPKNSVAITNLGGLYYKDKEYEKAAELLSSAIKELPQKDDPQILNVYFNLANAYSSLKKYEEAADVLTQALKIRPNDKLMKQKLDEVKAKI